MALEIERKFLVRGDYMPFVSDRSHIVQGYIARGSGRTVRVRIRDEKAYLTVKGPSADGGLSRFEWEKEISVEDARALLPLCEDGYIDKTRHLVPFGGHVFEVDAFHGANEGLVVAEVELSAPDEPFEKPAWLGEEVTGDRRYYNARLVVHPFSSWTQE